MTSNQIAAKQAKISAEQLKEQKRANAENENLKREDIKQRERDSRRKTYTKLGSDLLGTGVKVGMGLLNDMEWYNADPASVEYAGNISWSTPLGYPVDPLAEFCWGPKDGLSVPGILTMPFVPVIAGTETMNLASNRIYSWVRHANSGSRNYEAVDYMMFLIAADSIITNFCLAIKAIKCLYTYTSTNRYIGVGLLRSMGWTEIDIKNDAGKLANYQTRLQMLASSFNSLYIPSVFNYYHRHAELSEMVVKDVDREKSQLYHFVPLGYTTINPGNGTPDDATALEWVPYSGILNGEPDGLNLDFLLNTLEKQINAFLTIEDVGIMGGDSRKAFGDDSIVRIEIPSWPQYIEPVYSEEMLYQIQNAKLYGNPSQGPSTWTFDIWQLSGRIYQGNFNDKGGPVVYLNPRSQNNKVTTLPALYDQGIFKQSQQIIHKWKKDGQTPLETITSTRLCCPLRDLKLSSTGTLFAHLETDCVSEVVIEARITTAVYEADNYLTLQFYNTPVYSLYLQNGSVDGYNTQFTKGVLSFMINCFNHHPDIRMYSFTSYDFTLGNLFSSVVSIDMDDYAAVSIQDLVNMGRVAALSLWNVQKGDYKTTKGNY